MNPDSKNFDSLRRLLKLKRHEEPPPGYFNRFSRDVMARIKAGETGDKIGVEPAWFQRVVGMFEVKPVFAGAFGMAVCALLISGVVSSETAPTVATGSPDATRANFVADAPASIPAEYKVMTTDTNPVVQNSSLFEQYQQQQQIQTAPASYWIRTGN